MDGVADRRGAQAARASRRRARLCAGGRSRLRRVPAEICFFAAPGTPKPRWHFPCHTASSAHYHRPHGRRTARRSALGLACLTRLSALCSTVHPFSVPPSHPPPSPAYQCLLTCDASPPISGQLHDQLRRHRFAAPGSAELRPRRCRHCERSFACGQALHPILALGPRRQAGRECRRQAPPRIPAGHRLVVLPPHVVLDLAPRHAGLQAPSGGRGLVGSGQVRPPGARRKGVCEQEAGRRVHVAGAVPVVRVGRVDRRGAVLRVGGPAFRGALHLGRAGDVCEEQPVQCCRWVLFSLGGGLGGRPGSLALRQAPSLWARRTAWRQCCLCRSSSGRSSPSSPTSSRCAWVLR
jgi:hypothetical protein